MYDTYKQKIISVSMYRRTCVSVYVFTSLDESDFKKILLKLMKNNFKSQIDSSVFLKMILSKTVI